MAIEPVGEVDATLRVTTSETANDVRRELDQVAKDVDKDMADIGEDAGKSFDRGIKKETKDTGRDMARAISTGIEREGLRLIPAKIVTQTDANGTVLRRWVTERLVPDTERAISDAVSQGAFKKVGETFSSAIGSGFNVSGKSPLIALLIPVIGIIGELIGAAVQAAGALSALLFIVPNLVFAIGLQAGVLLLAFHGIGEAIQGAFAATNADELKKALEGLTPAAADFVKQLLPMRDLVKQLASIAQQGFFSEFGNILTRVFNAKSPFFLTLGPNIQVLAESLGRFARTLVGFLNDPVFLRFVSWIVPQITTWLEGFGPAMLTLLSGLSNIGFAVLPLFVWFGEVVNTAFSDFGQWLSDLSTDKDFLAWLEEVKVTLAQTWEVLVQAGAFIKTFVEQLNDAGGSKFLTDLADQLEHLTAFLATDEGKKALEGLIHIIQILAFTFVFFVNDILLFLFLIEVVAEFIKNGLLPAIGSFFEWLGEKIMWLGDQIVQIPKWIGEFFVWLGTIISDWVTSATNAVGSWILSFVNGIGSLVGSIISGLFGAAAAVINWFQERWNDVTNFFGSLGGRIMAAVGDFTGLMWQKGKDLVQGLINGVLSMTGPFGWAIDKILSEFKKRTPSSPAEEGPLSGQGDPMKAGGRIVDRLASGIEMTSPVLATASNQAMTNVVMGAGSVQMSFYGATPTTAQASSMGSAAGGSLADTLATRNTRLAVRSLGAGV